MPALSQGVGSVLAALPLPGVPWPPVLGSSDCLLLRAALPPFLGPGLLGVRLQAAATTSAYGAAATGTATGAFWSSSSALAASSSTDPLCPASWRWAHSGRREKNCHRNQRS